MSTRKLAAIIERLHSDFAHQVYIAEDYTKADLIRDLKSILGGVQDAEWTIDISSPIREQAIKVFGDAGEAMRWLGTPSPLLDGRTPVRALKEDGELGTKRVMSLLGAIERGVYL